MATIYALPTELVRLILSLAYPPGQYNSGWGLGRTSLVHSSWLRPSQSLQTQVVAFTNKLKPWLTKFVEGGPTGWRCQSLSFSSCSEPDVRVVLAKAHPGGIRNLNLVVTTKRMINGLFKFASLNKLQGLELVVDYKPKKMKNSPSISTQSELNFASWPINLSRIAISSPIIPFGLFANSTATLTSIDLHWTQGSPAEHLGSLGWYCGNVTELTLRQPVSIRSLELPEAVTRFVVGLPRLAHLTMTEVWPHHLEQLAEKLDHTQQLTSLDVTLWTHDSHIPSLTPYDQGQAVDEWEPSLRRVLKLPGLSQLARWTVRLRSSVAPGNDAGSDILFPSGWNYDDWPNQLAEWQAFRHEAAAAGIALVLVPVDE